MLDLSSYYILTPPMTPPITPPMTTPGGPPARPRTPPTAAHPIVQQIQLLVPSPQIPSQMVPSPYTESNGINGTAKESTVVC